MKSTINAINYVPEILAKQVYYLLDIIFKITKEKIRVSIDILGDYNIEKMSLFLNYKYPNISGGTFKYKQQAPGAGYSASPVGSDPFGNASTVAGNAMLDRHRDFLNGAGETLRTDDGHEVLGLSGGMSLPGGMSLSPSSTLLVFRYGGVAVHFLRYEEQATLSFLTRNQQVALAFFTEFVEWHNRTYRSHTLEVFSSSNLGWKFTTTQPRRLPGTLFLPGGLVEDVLAQARDFFDPDTVSFYADLGVPHRYGLCLLGLPGTGKSSIAGIVASEMGLDLHVLNLKGLSEEEVRELLQQLPARSVLLIDDVKFCPVNGLTLFGEENPVEEMAQNMGSLYDAINDLIDDEETEGLGGVEGRGRKKRRRRPRQGGSLDFEGFCRLLDSPEATTGRFIIFTSNSAPSDIKPQLYRSGRIDRVVEMPVPDLEVARRMFSHYYPKRLELAEGFASTFFELSKTFGIVPTPALIQGLFLRYLGDPEALDSNTIVRYLGENRQAESSEKLEIEPGKKVGEFFERLRVSRGMSLRELSSACGLSISTLSRIERGGSMDFQTAVKLCYHWQLSLDSLAAAL